MRVTFDIMSNLCLVASVIDRWAFTTYFRIWHSPSSLTCNLVAATHCPTIPGGLQIPIRSPGSGRGQLEITYLDEELRSVLYKKKKTLCLKLTRNHGLIAAWNHVCSYFCRISRGNRENLFILKMVDPSYRVPL